MTPRAPDPRPWTGDVAETTMTLRELRSLLEYDATAAEHQGRPMAAERIRLALGYLCTPVQPRPWTGAAFRAAREAAGLTPYGLAKKMRAFPGCGLTQHQHVHRWEGGSAPNADALRAAAAVLGLPMESLCDGEVPDA